MILSRFLINLRQVNHQPGYSSGSTTVADDAAGFSEPLFRVPALDNIASSFGEPLDFGGYDVDDTDDSSEDARSEKNEGHIGHIGLNAPLSPVAGGISGDTLDIQLVGRSLVRAADPMHDAS